MGYFLPPGFFIACIAYYIALYFKVLNPRKPNLNNLFSISKTKDILRFDPNLFLGLHFALWHHTNILSVNYDFFAFL